MLSLRRRARGDSSLHCRRSKPERDGASYSELPKPNARSLSSPASRTAAVAVPTFSRHGAGGLAKFIRKQSGPKRQCSEQLPPQAAREAGSNTDCVEQRACPTTRCTRYPSSGPAENVEYHRVHPDMSKREILGGRRLLNEVYSVAGLSLQLWAGRTMPRPVPAAHLESSSW
jgi:hypothetical protein